MSSQLYWEDVKEGGEITPLPKVATTQMLVKFAGASGDFNPLHYEDIFAREQGMERPIVHGQLKRAWLCQMMVDWIGEEGWLKKLSCQFRSVDLPRFMASLTDCKDGETWQCKGKITKKYVEGDEHLVECEIEVDNGKGEKTTTGTAVAVLPVRSA